MSFELFSVIYSRNISFFFFFNDTATTEIYTLSLHDALPICAHLGGRGGRAALRRPGRRRARGEEARSEEHTSELQSRLHLVCRLLLEKKKKIDSEQMQCENQQATNTEYFDTQYHNTVQTTQM